jgi:4-amino-4-deoxy-L-arabinose transferase-like glycosyltransferase
MSNPVNNPISQPSWSRLIFFAALVLLARIAYLIWLCPYDLAADEAQYWDWSRRLDWSYYSKGPAIAWLIAPAVHCFGITEWAVRLPAALAAFVSMLILAAFATHASGGNRRAGWLAMLLFCLIPVFHGTSQFMTTDGPYYACWLAAAFTGWIMARENRITPGWFFMLGSFIGLGMLCKYTVLLIVPGLLVFLFRHGSLSRGRQITGALVMLGGVILFALPIAIWNHQHGWPTISHLIGAMRLPGGDVAPAADWHYNPLWTVSYPFYAFALLGPPVALLLIRTVHAAYRPGGLDAIKTSSLHKITSFAIHLGLPVFLFYLLVSFRTDVKLNWPTATFVGFLVPLACYLTERKESDRATRLLWRWTVGLGLTVIILISFAPFPLRAIGKIKIAGDPINTERALKRVSGFPRFARSVEEASGEMERETGKAPFYVASTYGRAALLAFYMKNNPVVYCADSYRGGRESSYDYFTDTNLADPALIGRPAILFDHEQWTWERALYFQVIERTRFYGRVYRAYEYRGPCHEPHMK